MANTEDMPNTNEELTYIDSSGKESVLSKAGDWLGGFYKSGGIKKGLVWFGTGYGSYKILNKVTGGNKFWSILGGATIGCFLAKNGADIINKLREGSSEIFKDVTEGWKSVKEKQEHGESTGNHLYDLKARFGAIKDNFGVKDGQAHVSSATASAEPDV